MATRTPERHPSSSSLEPNQAKCSQCERNSCLPAEYPPQCSKHYLASVDRAQKEAAARFQKHIDTLQAAKGYASAAN